MNDRMNDELNLDELFQGLPHADRLCEFYGNCTCGRDEEILKIKSRLFTHIARLRKIEKAARELTDGLFVLTDSRGMVTVGRKEFDALAAALESEPS